MLQVIKKIMRLDAAESFYVPVNPIALGIPNMSDISISLHGAATRTISTSLIPLWTLVAYAVTLKVVLSTSILRTSIEMYSIYGIIATSTMRKVIIFYSSWKG